MHSMTCLRLYTITQARTVHENIEKMIFLSLRAAALPSNALPSLDPSASHALSLAISILPTCIPVECLSESALHGPES